MQNSGLEIVAGLTRPLTQVRIGTVLSGVQPYDGLFTTNIWLTIAFSFKLRIWMLTFKCL